MNSPRHQRAHLPISRATNPEMKGHPRIIRAGAIERQTDTRAARQPSKTRLLHRALNGILRVSRDRPGNMLLSEKWVICPTFLSYVGWFQGRHNSERAA